MPTPTPQPLFRRLFPGDATAFRGHLLRLSPEDRRFRFAGPATDLFLESYVVRFDWAQAVLIGCEFDGVLGGVAELKPIERTWPASAEVAFTVEGPYQGRGIGARLFRRIATIAANRGYRRLYSLCLAGNHRMRRIARGHDARVLDHADEVEGVVDLPWLTVFSLAEEVLDTGITTMTRGTRAA